MTWLAPVSGLPGGAIFSGRLIVGDLLGGIEGSPSWLRNVEVGRVSGRDEISTSRWLRRAASTAHDLPTSTPLNVLPEGEPSWWYEQPQLRYSFAQKMGIDMSEAEAAKLVSDWRAQNPNIGVLGYLLQRLLEEALASPSNLHP